MEGLPFLPVQASTVAPQVDLLLLILIALSGFFTSIVIALIFYFGVKYRRGNNVDRSNPPTTSMRIELGWVGGLLVLGMGTYAWAAIIYFNISRTPENPLDIYVVGEQWMWKVQHSEGPSEINELHVPTGRPVRLIMISQDVIHSFYVPAFRLKYDVIPGRYTNLWFEATRTGEYRLFCAEYCGTQHAVMGGRVVVMEPRQYQEWLAVGSQTGAPMADAGEQLFQQLGCSSCHAPDSGVRAPMLSGLFGQPVPLESGETVIADETYIRESILFPNEKVVAGYEPIMPSYEGRISEEQLLQLVSYIRSLGTDSGTGGETDQDTPRTGP